MPPLAAEQESRTVEALELCDRALAIYRGASGDNAHARAVNAAAWRSDLEKHRAAQAAALRHRVSLRAKDPAAQEEWLRREAEKRAARLAERDAAAAAAAAAKQEEEREKEEAEARRRAERRQKAAKQARLVPPPHAAAPLSPTVSAEGRLR